MLEQNIKKTYPTFGRKPSTVQASLAAVPLLIEDDVLAHYHSVKRTGLL